MAYQSLAEMFLAQVERYGDRPLYRFVKDGHWESYTWQDSLHRVRQIALGLVSLGVKKGDRVAILSANRVEWSLIDWANICIGALTVPIYPSNTSAQVLHFLDHSESTILFVDSVKLLSKIDTLNPSFRLVKKVVLLDQAGEGVSPTLEREKLLYLSELQEIGHQYGEVHGDLFEGLASSIRPEDDLTIIYTSGTTGEPKGVLTTHGHYLYMINAVIAAIPSTDQDVNLQFLPFAHSFGRLEHFMVVAKGYTCGFARSPETLAKDLINIRPTLLFSVPRVYENAYDRIRSRVAASSAFKRLLFRCGVFFGQRYSRNLSEGRKIPLGLRIGHHLAQQLVFSKIHSTFGGRFRLAISGGAPLAPEIAEFFHSLGILILEGYGLTETSTVSHVNRLDRFSFGTVGLPFQGVECRIGAGGEILLRGPGIFKGYYRDPEGTRAVIDEDGWFHTGDVGEIDKSGFLRITDRKKDLIVTSGGKNIAPQAIENVLMTDPLISQVMVFGDRQKHLLALIALKQDRIMEWGKHRGLNFSNPEEMISHPQVLALVKERIRQKNKELATFETVRNFRIISHDFSVEREELTPTLKLRRRVVMDRYSDIIKEMVGKARLDV